MGWNYSLFLSRQKMIPKEIIDDIVERAQVDEVVGEYVNLKKRGVNYLGLCPFHQERTPSFTVSPVKGIYKCFGCGRGGDSVSFLMEHEHFNYPEALKFLAKKYGIEVPEEELTDEQQASHSRRESLYIVLAFAEKYYQTALLDSDEGKLVGLSYIKERGINDESQKEFGIGFSPVGWDLFSKEALKKGYKEEFLVESGLSIKRDNGNLIDRFRERVMFPIHTLSGRTIGFGGRILNAKSKKEAKYINSPDTEVYNKSEVLYGLFQAKKAVKQKDICYLVEGYTDVISLHQRGVKNVVASSGTSLTEGQLRLVKRYTSSICFLFDGDAAGIKASLRAIDLALEEGLNVRALALPDGEDPDSFAKSRNQPEIEAYLEENSKDFIIFKTNLLLPDVGDDPIKKAEAIVQIVRSIALIPDQLKRTVYMQQCARLLQMEESVLITELNKQLTTVLKKKEQKWRDDNRNLEPEPPTESGLPEIPDGPQDAEGPAQPVQKQVNFQEEQLVKFILRFGHLMYDEEHMETVAEHILHFLEEYDAHPENEVLEIILKEYKSHLHLWGVAEIKEFLRHENEEVRQSAISLLEEKYLSSEHWIKRIGLAIKQEDNYRATLKRVINRYKLSRVKEMVNEAMEEIKSSTGADAEIGLRTFKTLMDLRKEIADELGIVVF